MTPVDIRKRTEIRCASCQEDHPILEWWPTGPYVAIPMIVCRNAPRGELMLVDAKYFGGGLIFPTYQGKVWITSRG